MRSAGTIFAALEEARNLIVVGSRIDHLHKNWVNYEYTSYFHKMMRDGRDKRRIFTILPDFPHDSKPPAPLSDFQYFKCPRHSLASDLQRLLESLG